MKIIDATNAVVGRLASYVAKEVLKGEEIAIVNSEKAIIVGKKKILKQKFKENRSKHGSSQKGPSYPTLPKNILKRSIRGMLPHTKERGKEALGRVKCYDGIPKDLEGKKTIKGGKGKVGIKLETISKGIR